MHLVAEPAIHAPTWLAGTENRAAAMTPKPVRSQTDRASGTRWADQAPALDPAAVVVDTSIAVETEPPLTQSLLHQLPSWLSSTALHLLVMIVLGLLLIEAPIGQRLLTLDVSLGGSGSGSGDDDSEDGGGALVEIDAPEPAESAPAAAELSEPLNELQPDAFADPLQEPSAVAAPSIDALPSTSASSASSMAAGELSRSGGAGMFANDEGLGAGSAGTAPTRTQVFGLEEEAASFVYVFDRSQSMNSSLSYSTEGALLFSITPLQAAKAELLRSIGDLDKHQAFQIIFYNHDAVFFAPPTKTRRLVAADAHNKRRAGYFVEAMPGEGGTYHLEPLELALRMRSDAIYLLTDGEAKDDPSEVDLDRLRGLNRGRTRINVIHFCFVPRPADALVALAKENGGRYLALNISQLAPGIDQNPAPAVSDASPAPGGTPPSANP